MLQSVMLDIGILGAVDPDYTCTTLLKFADKKTVWVVVSLFDQRRTVSARLHEKPSLSTEHR